VFSHLALMPGPLAHAQPAWTMQASAFLDQSASGPEVARQSKRGFAVRQFHCLFTSEANALSLSGRGGSLTAA
jgi:hypothetical protein